MRCSLTFVLGNNEMHLLNNQDRSSKQIYVYIYVCVFIYMIFHVSSMICRIWNLHALELEYD